MDISTIEKDFKNKVCEKIRLLPEGKERFKIFTPFMFNDGDHLVSSLRKTPEGWIISDEGHTYMHLSYEIDIKDLEKGTRQKVIDSALSMFRLQDQDGEITIKVENELFGDALFSFIQGVSKIIDVSYLSRERVKSTFLEDFKKFISEKIPENKFKFEYCDSNYDRDAKYVVDCMIETVKKPLFIFAIQNDDKCRDATISCLQFEKWEIPFRPIAIFEDQETINRKVLSRFSDVCEKQFSNLYSNRDRLEKYLLEAMQNNR